MEKIKEGRFRYFYILVSRPADLSRSSNPKAGSFVLDLKNRDWKR